MATLPPFSTHRGNKKREALSSAVAGHPEPFVEGFVRQQVTERGKQGTKILDMGCGRGDLVAWLCEQGWDAYGADLCDEYIEAGRGFMDTAGYGADRLRTIGESGLPFDSNQFDVVVSDQVLEHVSVLDAFARDVSRVTADGGVGLHICPGRWCIVEPHLRMPVVHWLPAGGARKFAIESFLRMGVGAPYFRGLPVADRATIYDTFLSEDAFYRTNATIRRAFGQHGLVGTFAEPTREKLHARLPAVPSFGIVIVGAIYIAVWARYFQTVKRR